MPDRILSTVVYDSPTNSYANLSPEVSPLLLNDTGDLIFNTNNLALYNKSSNNRIIRPTGPESYYFNTVLDNILIGGNNSIIYGACHSIINSDNATISGEYYSQPDRTYFIRNNSISNAQNVCIMNATYSSIINSAYTSISGGASQSIINSSSSCMINNSCSSMMNTWLSTNNGTYFIYNATGELLGQLGGGYDTNLLFGAAQRFYEAQADMRRFTGILGTGFANEYSSFMSSVTSNSNSIIFGGSQNAVITSRQALIANSFCSRISGVTNWNDITKRTGPNAGYNIACWLPNKGNVILGGDCSQINNQAQNNAIIGGCCNKIESNIYPLFFSGTDSTYRYCRTISNSAIIGGIRNCMGQASDRSIILGGCENKIYSGFLGSVILGGWNNTLGLGLSGCFSTINNGQNNSIRDGCFQNISAGNGNLIGCGGCNTILNGFGNAIFQSTGISNLIGNGESNSITSNPTNIGSCYNTIVNGKLNCNYSNLYSTIINGCNNKITSATSSYVLIGGGTDHCIVGNASYSYILGGRKGYVQNGDSGSAIIADGQDRVHNSSGPNTLTLDFANGIFMNPTISDTLLNITGSLV
jgi:hypothetical protein